MSNKKTDQEKLAAFIEALGDSVLESTDDEIIEELRLAGIDPDAEAVRLKAKMLATVSAFRQRALAAARAGYRNRLEQMQRKTYAIPKTPEARRELFSFVIRQPQYAEYVTAQYRDLENLTDSDIETYLQDLAELGILPKAGGDETDGE